MILRKLKFCSIKNTSLLIYFIFGLNLFLIGCDDPNPLTFPNSYGVLSGQVYNLSHPGPIPVGWIPPPYEDVCTVIIQDFNQKFLVEVNTDNKGKFNIAVPEGIYYLRVKESLLSSVTGPYHLYKLETLEVKANFDNGMR